MDPADWPHPHWVGSLELVAVAVDLVSKRRFRVWYDREEAERQVGRLRRDRRRPLVIEDVEIEHALVRLASWEHVLEWHDRELISAGWVMLKEFPGPGPDESAEQLPEPSAPPPQV
jgi:hypothetical protein